MSMTAGNEAGRARAEINVTPMIDVLLVLLIIFMVMVPLAPKGLTAALPQAAANSHSEPTPQTVVVQIVADGAAAPAYRINQATFAKSELEPELARIFATREQKAIFVQADAALAYSAVAEVVDMGHRAGVDTIGLLTPGSLER